MKYSTGAFEVDGAIIHVPVGFVPDYVMVLDMNTDNNIDLHLWWKNMEDEKATGLQEGVTIAHDATARMADGAGIVAYNTGADTPTIVEYSAATTPTARTATAAGTFTRPSATGTTEDDSTAGSADRDALFECVTSTGAVVTEPAWPLSLGGQVTDDGSNVWEAVVPAKNRIGYEGFTVSASIMTDGAFFFYNAFLADKSVWHGDVVAWPSGVYQGSL